LPAAGLVRVIVGELHLGIGLLGREERHDPLLEVGDGLVLAEDDRFFEKAALDSRYVAAMVSFIEDEFGVLVSSCEVTEENLGSLRAVARFVASKQPLAVG